MYVGNVNKFTGWSAPTIEGEVRGESVAGWRRKSGLSYCSADVSFKTLSM